MSDSDGDGKAAAASDEVTDLSNPDVVTKYKLAAQIANQTLQGVLLQLVPGKKVVEICEFGDTVIERQCATGFKSKKIEKGVAFPTCISVNEVVCHYSPFPTESIELKLGDSVKIDLGCHIDGYIAVVGHTAIVGESPAAPVSVTGPQADVIVATATAAEAALRTIKPGNTNTQVTAVIKDVADAFGVTPVIGTFSHQMKQFVIDGNKVIVQREEPDKKVDEITFEVNEVYAVDICFSTGEGKPRDCDVRTTVLKRVVDQEYQLKMKAARALLSEVNRRFPTLPFTLRSIEDERQARMGVVECIRHGLLAQYPVVAEREGSFVAHFKFTVLILPSGTAKITGLGPAPTVVSDKILPDPLKALLATAAGKKKKRSKKKGGAAGGAGGAAAAEEEDGDDE